MRSMRGVGVAAVGVAVAVVLSGCGGSGDGGEEAAGSSPSSTPSSVVPTEEPTEVPEPVYPPGPEGEIDELADEKGWAVGSGSASGFVRDICESLPVSAVDGASRPQWLVESGQMDGDNGEALLVGVPKLCPEWAKAVKEAVSGSYERWFGDGAYVVSSKMPSAEQLSEGEGLPIPPGTYRASGRMEDCYWERTSKGGGILDNGFATSAQSITVTIRASDGQFTARGCGVWKPVR
ncbi:hypothetical protein [Streptomyces californicus]|uniref:hypothetical protein n=1 Tax=Streptomyces californicus TaxID=67351 RepID=UPI0012FED4F0|nr:hypothetical protein [Streptomyces californicus]QRV59355.1 hypothetical protein I6J40_34405 [Streptomyces californicus]